MSTPVAVIDLRKVVLTLCIIGTVALIAYLHVVRPSYSEVTHMLVLLPVIAIMHEYMHVITLRACNVNARIVFEPRLLTFGVKLCDRAPARCVITSALMPQVLTLVLALAHVVTGVSTWLHLAVIHMLVSLGDLYIATTLLSYRNRTVEDRGDRIVVY